MTQQRKRTGLSKSRLLSYRQCAKRLWLETYRPELAEIADGTERRFSDGHQVGEIARQLYGPGRLIEPDGGLQEALRETSEHLANADVGPLFEATFDHHGLLVRTDVLVPTNAGHHLVEVKSSTAVKDPHIADLAIQVSVLRSLGVPLARYAIAHVDTSFVYPGGGDYRGLLTEAEVSSEVEPLCPEVPQWVDQARATLAGDMPDVRVGAHCDTPYPCPFSAHCAGPQPEYPISCLPRIRQPQVDKLLSAGHDDIRSIPESMLTNDVHLRVWRATRSGSPIISADLAGRIAGIDYPRYYLDFETIQFAVPVWAGTRPYEQLPFQWSCHIEHSPTDVVHREYLATGEHAPMHEFAETLIAALGDTGPVVVYSGFEKRVLKELSQRYPHLAPALERIVDRLVDLLPILRDGYYHPAMKGSWSIKKVLPTVAPELRYDQLEGVQDGGQAQDAFAEIVHPETPGPRRASLRQQLLKYCERDTEAMLVLARALAT